MNRKSVATVPIADPLHKCVLPELLQRMTSMKVLEIEDGMTVRPNHVYVIPPNQELGIEHYHFTLQQSAGRRGSSLSIDSFLTSLAAHSRDVAVGMVFSGMGTDGTLGLKAIRDYGGLSLVQLPSSARFASMPASAIAARVVDAVELPGQMMNRISEWWRTQESGLLEQQLFQLLLKQTGANFADYKLSTVLRRIDRRMKLRQCTSLADYVKFMRANPAEVELLFKELLIGVTNFFRDPKVWEYLMVTALPQLLAEHPEGASFKAWVAACSTGEEAYSLAIAFNEVLERLRPTARYTLQIFATDLDEDAVDFARQNVISDPPFTKLDILCCRNLLIYFTAKLQEQLIPLFHYALRTGGLLMLGSADTPRHFNELFTRRRQGQLEYPRHGARGLATRDDRIAQACYPGEWADCHARAGTARRKRQAIAGAGPDRRSDAGKWCFARHRAADILQRAAAAQEAPHTFHQSLCAGVGTATGAGASGDPGGA